MLFCSYVFVFAFLPLTLLGYFALSHTKSPYPQRVFLLLASLFFYGYFEWKYLIIIVSSITVNYLLSRLTMRLRANGTGRLALTLSVLFNVGLLGYYKYFDFFIENINAVASTQFTVRGILLPLGISFFTFQQIAFQLSIYRGDEKTLNYVDYALFVSFFPQLIAGPIVLFDELVPQILNPKLRRFNSDNFVKGLFIFTLGLFKKILLADTLAVIVDNGYAATSPLGILPAWVCVLTYSFQLMFDFTGYSDMAIGLGKMFNFDLPRNFNHPFISSSVGEFWKRWHITLGRALTTFVYIPLGGNRKGKARKCLNLFITFLVSGIWHGASWNYVLWGVAQGSARAFEEAAAKPLSKIPRVLRVAMTYLFTVFTLILVRSGDFSAISMMIKALFGAGGLGLSQFKTLVYDGVMGVPAPAAAAYALLLTAVGFVLGFGKKTSNDLADEFKPTRGRAVACAVMFMVSVVCMSRSVVFIYFNF